MEMEKAKKRSRDVLWSMTWVCCPESSPVGAKGYGLNDKGCRHLQKKLGIKMHVKQSTRFCKVIAAVAIEK